MVKQGSLRYNVLKIQELIKNYMNGSETAEIELSNLVVKGEYIMGALDEIRTSYDEIGNKAIRIVKTSRQQTHDLREEYIPTKKYTKSELEIKLKEYFLECESAPNNFPAELENIKVNGRDFLELMTNLIGENYLIKIGNKLKNEKNTKLK